MMGPKKVMECRINVGDAELPRRFGEDKDFSPSLHKNGKLIKS